jgi:hypothetical protein
MEGYCQENFEEMFVPNTQMDLINITSEIEGRPCEFIFDLNEMEGTIKD